MNQNNLISRRKAIGGMGAALASMAVTRSLAGSPEVSVNDPTNAPALENPLSKYPKPPFDQQFQPWPGLVSKMNPRPDHGETSYKGAGRLAGRKALITGGDSGMGRAAAIAYAREGADVAINYYPTEEPDAQEVVALIKAAGRKAVAIPGDLREETFCQRLVELTTDQLGGLDILVSNAGRQQSHSSILEISTDQFDWTMKTNIYAPFWIIKAALPHLPPGAAVIATTSVQAYDPSADLFDYALTKAATMNFVKSLAKQFASRGIRVNGVAPARFGRLCKSVVVIRRRRLNSLALKLPWEDPDNRRSLPLFMCNWLPMTRVIPLAKSMEHRAAWASHSRITMCKELSV